MQVRCPHCHTPTELSGDSELSDIPCPSCGSSFSLLGGDETTPYEAGTKTIGHFELLEQIGIGSFGFVWRARDSELDRTVAVKMPRKGQLDPEETEQFLREARAAAQLRHPNIVSVHEVGREVDSVFIVSDFVEGVTLADRLTAQSFSVREAAELCAKIADALHHAHEQGVIHRDVKPGNIILDGDGEPHIMDFGLARREVGEVTMTVEGRVLGTPAYMSPEQAKGSGHTADKRSDEYSLGVILFELLTGERPFRGNIRMLVHQVINDDPPSPRRLNTSVPRDLETICLKCLEKAAEQRYASAQALRDDLRRFLRGEVIQARPIGKAARLWRWCKRKPVVSSLAAGLAVVLVGGITGVTIQWLRAEKHAADAKRETERAGLAAAQEKEARKKAQGAQQLAEEKRRETRCHLYVAHMREVQRAWEEANIPRMQELLDRHRPAMNEEDLRSFSWYYWLRLSHGYVKSFDCGSGVASVAFSPDGTTVATSGSDVKLWDAATGALKATFADHTAWVSSVVFSPDGNALLSGSQDGTARLWKLEGDEAAIVLKGHSDSVRCVAISPDGNTVASGSQDRTIKVWDASNGKLEHTLEGHTGIVSSVVFSPDSSTLASGAFDRTLKLWNVASGDEHKTLESRYVFSLSFSPDGKLLAAANDNGAITIWDLAAAEPKRTLASHSGSVFCAVFSNDGTTLASSGEDRTIRLWDMTSERTSPTTTFKGHAHWVKSLDFSPDGNLLASGSSDHTAKLWDLSRAEAYGPHENKAKRNGHEGSVEFLTFSPDGTTLATASRDHQVKLWTVDGGELKTTLTAHTDTVESLVFSPDGKMLVSGGLDRTVRLWDVTTGEEKLCLDYHGFDIHCVALSLDGKLLAFGGGSYDQKHRKWSEKLKLWDVVGGAEQSTLTGHAGAVTSVAFSCDGKTLASACGDQTVKLWNVTDGNEMATLRGHTDVVSSVAFSPHGRKIASGSYDRTVKLWDVDTRRVLADLTGHSGQIDTIAFSPDGRTLAVGGLDNTVTVWDIATRERLITFPLVNSEGVSSHVTCVTFSPDGAILASNFFDAMRLWRATPPNEQDY